MMRQMEVPAEWVATGETGAFPTTLGTDIEPAEARELQGTMFFAFPDLEVEGVSIFEVPGVVDWLGVFHERIPHLIYFLDPTPSLGALEGLIATVLRRGGVAIAPGEFPLTEELLNALAVHLNACARFATQKGDDWEPIVSRFVEPLPEPARDYLRAQMQEAG